MGPLFRNNGEVSSGSSGHPKTRYEKWVEWSGGFQETLDEGMQDFFEGVGKKVSKMPKTTLLASVVVATLMGLGLIRVSIESDDDKLYVPRGSVAVEEAKWVEKT